MELLASLFVAKPQNILLVTVVFLTVYLALRFTPSGIGKHPGWLLVASGAWGLYAAWEWLVQVKTPEANIRVDLLVIWPLLAILTLFALYRAFR
jgi:hypothetical protein